MKKLHDFNLSIVLFLLFTGCGVKAPPLPPEPVIPQQTEIGRPVPVPSPSLLPVPKIRKIKGARKSQ